jgi:membrane-associated protein
MPYRRFVFFNFSGGLLWATGVTLVGYGIGTVFGATVDPETLDKYFLLLIIAVIFISALPAMIHIWRDNKEEIVRRLRRQPAKPAASEMAKE